jgi:hypothetical protein
MSESQNKPSRRGFMWGAAAVGAAAAAVTTLPKTQAPETAAAQDPQPNPPANGGGYRVTEHVRRYYKTTLV